MTSISSQSITLEPQDNARLQALCGAYEGNLQLIEKSLQVSISRHDFNFSIQVSSQLTPEQAQAKQQHIATLIQNLYDETLDSQGKIKELDLEEVHIAIQESQIAQQYPEREESKVYASSIKTKRGLIKPRGANQIQYLHNIFCHDICFGIGPAGTGKTFLAVAAAVEALEKQEVRKLLLTRPAVEAGEKLGFLPGDLGQKIEPYLRPLYDALFEMLGFEKVQKLMERNVIEIAPLAYMRGRTLNDSFIILDESQNTTIEQMKMFLTRIGFNSKAVITGDITQIDLPRNQKSGLRHAMEVLENIPELSFNYFASQDIVRHPVVAKVVQAYDKWEAEDEIRRAEREAIRKQEREAKLAEEQQIQENK
ncbi:AAA family ATPase [[Haemophilus] felis]|uniref:PhoH-like protein n=1 Tax=[Haemophilus] felis TaxID=123822 RepID=A0A1T0AYU6_9PAST|nr:AAA family ATPase [[Haemophilus] felis]NBI40633.1 AAA family ATPase [[Haemophilus] felis]OOS02994.1 nucleoside triphosphate hydrolase [[Haemophilus] felis]